MLKEYDKIRKKMMREKRGTILHGKRRVFD